MITICSLDSAGLGSLQSGRVPRACDARRGSAAGAHAERDAGVAGVATVAGGLLRGSRGARAGGGREGLQLLYVGLQVDVLIWTVDVR